MPAQIKHCTSCGSEDIVVAGNKFLCRPCNIVYEVTDTGTKVLDTNPLAEHEQRLASAERAIAVLQKAGQGDEPSDPVEQQIDKETEELHELPSEEEIDRDIEENSRDYDNEGFIILE